MKNDPGILSLCLILVISIFSCDKPPSRSVKSGGIDSVYNAGHLVNDDTIRHIFYIKSTGEAELKIDSVVSSCDCVTLTWQKTLINPGKTGFIKVAIKPNIQFKGRGIIKRYIMVKTNAANRITAYQVLYSL